jgi:ABC-type glycerol-3-phosphate transport system substrate-binding protein
MAFYARLVAGPERIGQSAGANQPVRVRALAEGDFGAIVTPDWGVPAIREWAPELAGKLAMMPLPRFEPGDYPTSTWGGTMAAIPRNCADPERAWRLLIFLVASPDASRSNHGQRMMLPAIKASWEDPKFHEPDGFFGGQRVGELWVEMARQIPPRVVTPFTTIASGELSLVLHRAVSAAADGESDEGLRRKCAGWLEAAQRDLERYIRFGEFE